MCKGKKKCELLLNWKGIKIDEEIMNKLEVDKKK